MSTSMIRRIASGLAAGALVLSGFAASAAVAAGHHVKHRHTTARRTTTTSRTTTTTRTTTTPVPVTTTVTIPATTVVTPVPITTTPTTTTTAGMTYPLHSNIVATTFWVGEIFNASIADGSQDCSTYDANWAFHWSGGVNVGTDPSTDCKGSIVGGCDGIPSGSGGSFLCRTEARTSANNYFPTSPLVHPAENPFYLDLPFDDVNDRTAFAERCQVIPWAAQYPASSCANPAFSYLKNRWVRIIGPNGHTCYGQVEDAGPSHGSLYHDATYVFGATNAQPVQGQFNDAGMDVSPALNGCLGFAELDGDSDHVSWQFVDAPAVAPGPWTLVVTTSPVN